MVNSAIVPSNMVEFGASTTQADSLDGVVVQSEGTPTMSNYSSLRENMIYVTEAAAEAVKEIIDAGGGSWINSNLNSDVKSVLPYFVMLKKLATEASPRIHLESISGNLLKEILAAQFGEEIRQSGIYEALGINQYLRKKNLNLACPLLNSLLRSTLAQLKPIGISDVPRTCHN